MFIMIHKVMNIYIDLYLLYPNIDAMSKNLYIYKCKNIFTKMLNDVGIEVPKSIETRSKFSMHADKGRG